MGWGDEQNKEREREGREVDAGEEEQGVKKKVCFVFHEVSPQ